MGTRNLLSGMLLAWGFCLTGGGAVTVAQETFDHVYRVADLDRDQGLVAAWSAGDSSDVQILSPGIDACAECTQCDSQGCDGCCATQECRSPWWAHRSGLFGEFLYLRPGDSDIVYSIEQNDTTVNAFPTGPLGIAAIDASPGYRVGFSLASSQTSSLVASYTHWDGNTQDRLVRNNANVLNSQIIHPSTFTTGGNSLQSSAATSIEFDLIDAVYRHKLICTDTTIFYWSGGFRYGTIEQSLLAQQEISVATGLVTVDTDVDFNGFGILLGCDAERRSCQSGMLCYSKGAASFLGGEWTGDYRQSNQFTGGIVANQYEDFRISPVLETELGIGWQSESGCVRATAGYMASWWCNAVSTREYVDGVRRGNYLEIDDTIAFIGLTTRLEVRY
ncbi:Lpg1974 family pore-forming outer membrane protein [Rosistilla oblonga]|uniref:Lpg1974 family pore-forming outer membrane protein n=1 Tax=Rosistilla oblonga TaxID=2527990 RepID=UPI003A969CE3